MPCDQRSCPNPGGERGPLQTALPKQKPHFRAAFCSLCSPRGAEPACRPHPVFGRGRQRVGCRLVATKAFSAPAGKAPFIWWLLRPVFGVPGVQAHSALPHRKHARISQGLSDQPSVPEGIASLDHEAAPISTRDAGSGSGAYTVC